MATNHVGVQDLDMSAIFCHVGEKYGLCKAEAASATIAQAMVDGVSLVMGSDNVDAAFDGFDCVAAQMKHYGLEKDKELLDMVEDCYLDLSIEAGVREMDGIDFTQFL